MLFQNRKERESTRRAAAVPSIRVVSGVELNACLNNPALLHPIDLGSQCMAHEPKILVKFTQLGSNLFIPLCNFGSPSQAAAAGGGALSSGRKKIKARGSWCATWREIELRAADPVQWEEAPMNSRMQDLSLNFPFFRIFFVPSALSKYFFETFS